jgi:3-phenylpropionate/trans-cinnamate dioxygenase ferredoxin reductase subunit
MRYDVLIVGAGHGGAQAAIALRQHGYAGTVALAGNENELPYERPPLSKEYLSGKKPFERILIRPAEYWAARDIALLPGRHVASVDPEAREVAMQDSSRLGYGALVWAAGGNARRLACPGHGLEGVHTLRSRADVDRMVGELPSAEQVVIIGGGYIGLEAAAVLTELGKRVAVLEAQDRVLARVAGEPLSRFFEAEHRARGVDVRLGVAVSGLGGDGRVSGVQLGDGALLPAGMVLVGIGISPAVAPLLDAGAAGGNGVEIDAQCRTSLPGIYAVGDCALQSNPFAGGAPVRIESVQNANDQAAVVARDIIGSPVEHQAVPVFWSHQYDLRLQTAGLSGGNDSNVVRGDPATRSFSVVYLRQGRVIALDCVNAMRDYAQGRALVVAGQTCDPAALADTSVPLKSLVRQA